MAQLSLYMTEASMEGLRADAERAGESISAYARKVLEGRNKPQRGWTNGWPPNYFESLKPLEFDVPIDELPSEISPLEL